ncbi:MAG TPA: GIY-YIG nuclease family protein, partial [Rhabdochlamydiaceae bacterium]
MESFGTIYKLTNMVNGKLYVGQTDSTLEKRWSKHVRTAKLGSPFALSRAIRKYGPEKFKSEIIETVEIANLSNREIFWIKELNSKCFDSGHGYNMT